MSTKAPSDVGSDDGNWSDIYDGAEPQNSALKQIGESVIETGNPAAAPADAAADSRTVPATGIKQDNHMVDHRSTTGEQINDDAVTDNTTNTQPHLAAQAEIAPTPSLPQQVLEHAQNLNASAAEIAAQILHLNQQTNPPGPQNHDAEVEFFDTSSNTSSDDDSDDSDDSEPYELLTPALYTEMLMRDNGDEDDGDDAGKMDRIHQVRTANEREEEAPQRPDIQITPDMMLYPLGKIISIVDGTILVKSSYHGVDNVLKDGTLVTTQDRRVVGLISDTLGRVQDPMYTIPLGKDSDELMKELGLAIGVDVTYSEQHSQREMTSAIKALPSGTDASNVHDEEVDLDDEEFSDDEKELAYRQDRNYAKKKDGVFLRRSEWQHNQSLATMGITPGAAPTGRPNTTLPASRPQTAQAPRQHNQSTHRRTNQGSRVAHPSASQTTRPVAQPVPAFGFGHTGSSQDAGAADLDMDDAPRESYGGLANVDAERQTRNQHIVLDYDGDGQTTADAYEPYQPLRRPDNYADFANQHNEQSRPRSVGNANAGTGAPWHQDRRGRGARGSGRGRGDRGNRERFRGSSRGNFSGPSRDHASASAPAQSYGQGFGQQHFGQPAWPQQTAAQAQSYAQPVWPQQTSWQMPHQQAWPQQNGFMTPQQQHAMSMMYMFHQNAQQQQARSSFQNQGPTAQPHQQQTNSIPPPPPPPPSR